MATLDSIQLFDSGPTSGAAFLLTAPAREPLFVSHEGWTAEAQGRYLIIRKPVALSGYVATRDAAFAAAQEALDVASMSRIGTHAIRDAETEHLTWWPEASGQVLRVTFLHTFSVGFDAIVTATDAKGNPLPRPAPAPVQWHASARYYRRSQTTDDLFDSFRNLHLALESILDYIAPPRRGEREADWIRRALTEAGAKIDLSRFAPTGAADPVGEVCRQLYTDTRNPLFHAKGSRPRYLPHGTASEKEAVVTAVRNLSQLYLALAGKEFNALRATGRFFPAAFDGIRKAYKSKLRLHVTEDPAPAAPDGTAINPLGGVVLDLETRHVPEDDGPFFCAFVGSVRDPAGKLRQVTRLAATMDGVASAYGDLEGVLTLEAIDRVEGHLGVGMMNAGWPKERFLM